MRKLILFTLILTMAHFANASPLPPQPVCQIKAQLLKEKIKVIELVQVIQEGYDKGMCENYKPSDELSPHINIINPEGLILNTGDIVVGDIQYGGDEYSQGFDFKIIKIVNHNNAPIQ